MIGVRTEANGLYVQKIETLVSDAGDWLFNATGTAYWNSFEKWDPIPVGERDTREVIQAAGDAYFDRFGNLNVTVPFGKSSIPKISTRAIVDDRRHTVCTSRRRLIH